MNKFTYLLLPLFCMMGVTKAYAGIGDPLEKVDGQSLHQVGAGMIKLMEMVNMTASLTVTSKTFGIPIGAVSMEAMETAVLCLSGSSLT